ncbi:MAG TPA: hypothetical protein VF192_00920 [Longimicrobiales bacterium]
MARTNEQPTFDEHGYETHPAWGLIGAYRVQNGLPGAVLFDSDIRHGNTVRIRLSQAVRQRDLHRDWHGTTGRAGIVEVEMSEAQWASFVSSMNVGDGVPCTLRRREGEEMPGVPYEPRLQESMAEVRSVAEEATEEVAKAFAAYREKKTAANLRTLQYAIENMPSNVTFAAKSLNEHAENVVQKARADIEAMVVAKAHQLGLEPGDLGISAGELPAPDER